MSTKYSQNSDPSYVRRGILSKVNSGLATSEVPVKTSPFDSVRKNWLIITIGLIAIAGILGTIGVAVVAFAVLRQTTITSTAITITTTNGTSITTAIMCFVTPTPRPSNSWFIVDTMSTHRYAHTSTFMSQDNSVVIAGGLYGVALISTDKYIPSTGCFHTGINMPRARRSHTADKLSAFSNYIIFAGGYGTSGALSVADLFDPITGNTLTLSLTAARYAHASAVFGSSQLVLVGGIAATYLDSGDAIYSGSTSTFYSTSNTMIVSRTDLTATRLGNNSGIVLIAGGRNSATYYASTELFYGASNAFLSLGAGGTMSSARAYHTSTYIATPFDTVLITGGCYDGWNHLNTMTLFDVATLSFTDLANTMSSRRSWHTATLLPNGKILIVGGFNNALATASCDLIDPANNYLLTPAANLNTARYQHTATLIPSSNSTVLICGSMANTTTVLNTCELYFI